MVTTIDLTESEDTMLTNVVEGVSMTNLKDFLTVRQAASLLGVSPETLRRWDNAKKLKSYRHSINKYRLYKKADLEKFLKRIKQK